MISPMSNKMKNTRKKIDRIFDYNFHSNSFVQVLNTMYWSVVFIFIKIVINSVVKLEFTIHNEFTIKNNIILGH